MTASVTVVDPRMPAPAGQEGLAERASDLDGRRVLLLDNGKLGDDYGPYRAVFEAVTAELEGRFPNVEIVREQDDLLAGDLDRLYATADRIAASGVVGVVIALCDWGVSQPSTILAAELEQRGVAVCMVAMEAGFLVTLATAVLLMPGLPIVKLASLRDVTYEDVREEADRLAPTIVDGLTGEPQELHHRFEAHEPDLPPVANADGRVHVDGEDTTTSFTDLMAASGLGDGFPLVPPTPELVDGMLAAMGVTADERVWPAIPPRRVPVVAREIATLAVMAGVPLASAPVVIAAYRAMAAPEFRLFQAAITTHPGGALVLVSGPRSNELGIESGRGCLGPGFRGNASVGRAVSLGFSFLLGSLPGRGDLTAQGSPAQFSYCCAENLAEAPWAGVHADMGHPGETTVTVSMCEAPHNMTDQMSSDPSRLLDTFSSTIATLGGNTAYVSGCQNVVFLNPEHAAILAAAGWTKSDVQNYLFETARNDRSRVQARGLAPIWPKWFHAAERVPVVTRPEDFILAVVGGSGPASQVAIPWGYSRAVTLPID